MIEPVAYMLSDFVGNDFTSLELPKNPNNPRGLYFKEQLHPRVKMTQKQYKEWQQVTNSIYPFNLYELFNLIFNPAKHHGDYAGMRDIFSFTEGQKKLARLWADYDPDNPEETIEIVTNMKWFVISKEKENGDYQFMAKSRCSDMPRYTIFKSCAMTFDTKDEAERWVNPLTEAVQLPV